MTNLIVEVSKYLMILLMAVYTYANFRYFSLKDMGRKQRVCAGQNRAMYAIHFLAYVVMYLKTENDGVRLMLIAFYAAQVVFFLCYIYLYRFCTEMYPGFWSIIRACCCALASSCYPGCPWTRGWIRLCASMSSW